MKLIKLPLSLLSALTMSSFLVACGSIEQAAQDDCTSIGWEIGSKGYQDCYKARLYERKLDYSNPPGDQPSPSLI
jgi:hypothetical protein